MWSREFATPFDKPEPGKETVVSVELRPGWTAEMPVSEVRALAQRCIKAIRSAPRVKCPTCRCHILAEEECMCCKFKAPDEEEPCI